MIGWLIAAAYAVAYVYTARKIIYAMDASDYASQERHDRRMRELGATEVQNYVDAESLIVNRVGGLLLGLLCPFILVGVVLTVRIPKTAPQLRLELAERDRYITKLEKELEIGR